MKKLLVLSMLSVFAFSTAAYACEGKDHKASAKSSKGDSPSAKKDSQDKAKAETSTKS